jgi:hypothetical protein
MSQGHSSGHLKAAVLLAATITLSGTAHAREGGHRNGETLRDFRESHPELRGGEARRLMMGGNVNPSSSAINALTQQNQQQWLNKHWQAPMERSVRTVQMIDNVANNIRGGVDLDLTSSQANITLGSKLMRGLGSVTITAGGAEKTLSVGEQVTAGEFVAIKQELSGKQTITLDASGRATGGTLNLDSIAGKNDRMKASSLVVSEGLNVTGDFAKNSDFRLTGDLVNNGSVFATSSRPSARTGAISADDIINSTGALISTQGDAPFDLSLNARGSLINSGEIQSSGTLTLSAGNNVLNDHARIVSRGNIDLVSAKVSNVGGSISSDTGDINAAAPVGVDLTVTNSGGTFSAVNGSINIGNADNGVAKVATTVTGGDFNSLHTNLFSGDGTLNFRVENVDGTVNAIAGIAHISASTANLKMGDVTVSGDPTIINTAGNVLLSGNVGVAGAPLAILASGDIIGSSGTVITTSTFSNAGNVLMVAGAALNDNGTTVTISPGNGGSIVLTADSLIDASSIFNQPGTVDIIAFSGVGGVGNVSLGTLVTNTNSTLIPGASVNIIAPGNISGNDLIGGSSSNTLGGTVKIVSAIPGILGGTVVVDKASGAVMSGSFDIDVVSNGTITFHNIDTGGSDLRLQTAISTAGQGIRVNRVDTDGGDVTIQSSSLIDVAVAINTYRFGGIGINPGDVNITSFSSDPADFHVPQIGADTTGFGLSGGDVTVVAPIDTFGLVGSGLGFIRTSGGQGGTGGDISINSTYTGTATIANQVGTTSGFGNSGNLTLTHAGALVYNTSGAFEVSAPNGFNNGNLTITATGIQALQNFILISSPLSNQGTGDITLNANVTAGAFNVQLLAGRDISVQNVSAQSFISLNAGRNVAYVSLTSSGAGSLFDNSVGIAAKGTVAGGNINATSSTSGTEGGIISIQTTGNSVAVGNLIADGNGAGGGQIFVQSGGDVAVGIMNATADNVGNGGSVRVIGNGNFSTGSIQADAGAGSGALGGTVSLTYDSAVTFSINVITANAFAPGSSGGSITIENKGFGLIDVANEPLVANGGGVGGKIDLRTLGGMSFAPSVSSLIVSGGTGGGTISLSAGSFDFPGASPLLLVANTTSGTRGTINVEAINDLINLGTASDSFDLSVHTGFANIKATSISANQALSMRRLGLTSTVSNVNINQPLNITGPDFQQGGLSILSSENINLDRNVNSSVGMLLVARGNIQTTPTANIQITTTGGNFGGAISMVAGASFSDDGTTVTINGPSLSGGDIDFTTAGSAGLISSAGAAGGRNITMVAYEGLGGGRVLLPAASTINSASATLGTSGAVTVIAGASSGTSIGIGNVVPQNPGFGGGITLATVTPVSSVAINKGDPDLPLGSFQGSATQNAALVVLDLRTSGEPITLIGGSSITINGTVSSSRNFSGVGGDISMTTNGTISTGAISANGLSNTSGTISLSAGGDITLGGNLTASSSNSNGGGGQVFINTSGNILTALDATINTTAFGAGSAGGTIVLSASSLLTNNSFNLTAPGSGGADDGTISITTSETSSAGDLKISTGSGMGFVLPNTGPTGALSLNPGHNLNIASAVQTGTLEVTLLSNNVATQAPAASLNAGNLSLNLENGLVDFTTSTSNAISVISASATGTASGAIKTTGDTLFGPVSGTNLDLQVNAIGNITANSAMQLHGLDLTAGGAITVNAGADIDAAVTFSANGPVTIGASVGRITAPSVIVSVNNSITGSGTIIGNSLSLDAKTTSGSLVARLHVNAGTLSANTSGNGSFFIDNAFASEYTLNNSSAGTGTLDISGSSSIKVPVGQTLTGNNVALKTTTGGFTLLGTINAPVSASLTSFASITNGTLGTLTTSALNVTSLNGDIGTNPGSRFNTSLTTVSASALNGSVYLNLTGGATTIGDSTALNNFDVTSASSINTGGTITADHVLASASTGSVGTSTGSRFHVDADQLTASAPGGNVNINNTGTGSLQLDSITADTSLGTVDILSAGSLVPGAGSIAGANLVLLVQNGSIGVSSGNRLSASASNVSLTAPNGSVFYQSTSSANINAASAANTTTGVFDFASSGNLTSSGSGTVGGNEVVISVPSGLLSLGAPITATTRTTIMTQGGLLNSNFAGISSPQLSLTSQLGDIGSGANRFQTNATTVSANSVTGNVFLDLTGNNVALGSVVGGTVDIVSKNISDGPIVATTVTLASTGNIGVDANSRLLINATSFSASTSTGSVFLENLKTGTTTLTGNVNTTGIFFVVAAGTLQANGDITAQNIVLSAPSAGLDLGGDLLATNLIALTASSDLTNATFVGSIVAPSLALTSTAGSVGTSTSSRFSTGASTVSANGATGVFLDLTNASGVTMGTSSAGTAFDVSSDNDIKGGTITAPIVRVSAGGGVGVSTAQRLLINAATFTVSATSGDVFLSNTRTGSSTLTGTVSGTTVYDIIAGDSLVIAGNINASNTISVASGNLLSATSGALTANNIFLRSTGDLLSSTFSATISASQLLGLESVSGNIGSLANRFTTTAPTVETNSGLGTFLNIPLTATGVTLQDSSAGTTLNVATSNVGILNLNGTLDTANGDMSITVNGLGSSLNVTAGSSLTTTEGDIALLVTDQTKVKTVPVKIFIGNGATIKGSGTTAGVGEVFIGTGTLPFVTSPKNKKPPKGVTVTNVAPGQVFLGKKGIGFVKKSTGISLNALSRNLVFNIGAKEKRTVVTIDSNVTITADPPGDVAPMSAARAGGALQLVPMLAGGSVAQSGDAGENKTLDSSNWTLFGSLDSNSETTANLVTASMNALSNSLRASAEFDSTGSSIAMLQVVGESGGNDAEFVSDVLVPRGNELVARQSSNSTDVSSVTDANARAAEGNEKGKLLTTMHRLVAGAKVYAPAKAVTVETPSGQVKIAGGSLVLMVAGPLGLAVYDLHDSKKGSVQIYADGKEITLSPGRHALVSHTVNSEFADVNPIEMIPHRGVERRALSQGKSAFVSEFSILSAIDSVPSLRRLTNSKHAIAKKLSGDLFKTVAIVLSVGGSQEQFKYHARPQLTASR